MKEKNQMTKKRLVSWAFCRRKPNVNVDSRITSDIVITDKRKNV